MDIDAISDSAIQAGQRDGASSLDHVRRVVFLISEAEVTCDKDGIDSLLHRYGQSSMLDFAQAFLAIGAADIARQFAHLAQEATCEDILTQANTLVTARSGYSYESVRSFVSGAV